MSASTGGANTGTRGGGRSSCCRGWASRPGSWRCSGWSSSSGRSPRALWLHPSLPSHRRSGTSRTSSHHLKQSTVSTQRNAMQCNATHPLPPPWVPTQQGPSHGSACSVTRSHIWHQAAAKPTEPRFVLILRVKWLRSSPSNTGYLLLPLTIQWAGAVRGYLLACPRMTAHASECPGHCCVPCLLQSSSLEPTQV